MELMAWALALLMCPGTAAARQASVGEHPANSEAPRSLPLGGDRGCVLRSADGVNSLRINGLFQPQLTLDGSSGRGGFQLNRARVGLLGSVFSRDLQYMLVAEFSGGEPKLLFLSLDYVIVRDWLALSVGQVKRPFSRSFITPASQLSMIDRPMTVGPKAFGDSADIGVMLHNGTSRPFEYSVSVFNGAGPGSMRDSAHPLIAVRVGYNSGGLNPYRESDLEGGAPRLGIAAAGLLDFDAEQDTEPFARGLVDVMFKAYVASLTSALYASTRQDGPGWSDQRFGSIGHYTQLGYVIVGRFEPVVRYSFLLPDGRADDAHEVAGGLNVFFHGHAFKWQNSLSVRFQPRYGGDTRDVRIQSQLSLAL
jgi:hypothetical protein